MPRRRPFQTMKTYGKTFRTRSGRLGRYVYRFGKRIAFEGIRSGGRRYVAEKTYRSLKRRYK